MKKIKPLVLILLISFAISSSAISNDFLGISPQDEKYYEFEVIKCKDGSKKFKREQLNDNFCDCLDGTDEPGTSACPEGRFYCQNAGHSPLILFSSRVNDGICDCCDGSDEYDGKTNCPNTCWEAGKVARDKLKKKIATYQEGVNIRKKEVEKAKEAFARDESELLKLKKEEKILKDLVQQLKEKKEQIERAEEEERIKKENEKKSREAEKNASTEDKHAAETTQKEVVGDSSQEPVKDNDETVLEDKRSSDGETESVASIDSAAEKESAEENDDASVKDVIVNDAGVGSESSHHATKQEQEKKDDTEGLSKEELGRLVASRWTGENVGEETNELDNAKDEEDGNSDIPDTATNQDYDDNYYSDMDEDDRKYANDDIEDTHAEDSNGEDEHYDHVGSYGSDVEEEKDISDSTIQQSQSWLGKLQQTVRNILQAVNLFKTPVDLSEASHVRKQYDESSQRLSKMQSRISSLSEKLKHDFGMEKEFYPFYDRCFENKQSKYVYKVCPFKQASQIEGHSTTQLGRWDNFKESYRIMQFSNGERCWNGPDRSLKVRLRCGLTNEVTDVDEPSRCEYIAVLSTPALCHEEKLKELQQKLDSLSINQSQNHDEL